MKVWATKIISEFQNYLEAGKNGIERRCTYLTDKIAGIKICTYTYYCRKNNDHTNHFH